MKDYLAKNALVLIVWLITAVGAFLQLRHNQNMIQSQADRQDRKLEKITAELEKISDFKTTIAVMDTKMRRLDQLEVRVRELEIKSR